MSWRKGQINRRIWGLVRLRVLDRDGWRCVTCGKSGRLEVDHIKPMDLGGAKYDKSNLQALCRPCHFAKTARENMIARGLVEKYRWRTFIAERLEKVIM